MSHRSLPGWLLSLLAVGGFAALGCSGAPQDASLEANDVASQEAPIIGGTDDPTGDPAIVAILATLPGATGSALCTGTIIAPTVVLTAAHCVDPAVIGGTGATFIVTTDTNLSDGIPADSRLAVKETHFDPQFDSKNLPNGHDIAVVILAEPTTITPIPWNQNALPASLKNGDVRIVGYGLNDGFGQKGAGVKRTAITKLTNFTTELVTHGTNTQRICQGDSGGPVLAKIDGVESVIGVNSYGFIFCLGTSNSTRVDTYKAFVQSFLTP